VAYIFKCDKSTLQIKGKVNSITVGRQSLGCVLAALSCDAETCPVRLPELRSPLLDNCKKFGLVFDHVVGIVEVINSKDIQIQVSSL
jgi:adenylyl cyclase-associated protein